MLSYWNFAGTHCHVRDDAFIGVAEPSGLSHDFGALIRADGTSEPLGAYEPDQWRRLKTDIEMAELRDRSRLRPRGTGTTPDYAPPRLPVRRWR